VFTQFTPVADLFIVLDGAVSLHRNVIKTVDEVISQSTEQGVCIDEFIRDKVRLTAAIHFVAVSNIVVL
jgi:hypothetical protein